MPPYESVSVHESETSVHVPCDEDIHTHPPPQIGGSGGGGGGGGQMSAVFLVQSPGPPAPSGVTQWQPAHLPAVDPDTRSQWPLMQSHSHSHGSVHSPPGPNASSVVDVESHSQHGSTVVVPGSPVVEVVVVPQPGRSFDTSDDTQLPT
jgi:hypothetical protein